MQGCYLLTEVWKTFLMYFLKIWTYSYKYNPVGNRRGRQVKWRSARVTSLIHGNLKHMVHSPFKKFKHQLEDFKIKILRVKVWGNATV